MTPFRKKILFWFLVSLLSVSFLGIWLLDARQKLEHLKAPVFNFPSFSPSLQDLEKNFNPSPPASPSVSP